MTDIKYNILSKIKSGELSQKSRWYFLTRDYFFWAITAIAVVTGSLASASLLHQLLVNQIPFISQMRDNPDIITTLFLNLPFFWIALFCLLVITAWYNYRHTSGGHRHYNSLIVASVVVVSMSLGTLLFAAGLGKEIDQGTRERVPLLQKQFEKREVRREAIEQRIHRKSHLQSQARQIREQPRDPRRLDRSM